MAHVIWSDRALDRLSSIADVIAQDAPAASRSVVQRAFQATERLANFPRSGRIVPEFEVEHVREIIVGNYRVIYQLEEGAVIIATVVHGAQALTWADIE